MKRQMLMVKSILLNLWKPQKVDVFAVVVGIIKFYNNGKKWKKKLTKIKIDFFFQGMMNNKNLVWEKPANQFVSWHTIKLTKMLCVVLNTRVDHRRN